MSQSQFLLSLLIIIPLCNALAIKAFHGNNALVNIISKCFPLLFLSALSGIFYSSNHNINFNFKSSQDGISLVLGLDKISLISSCLLNFLWIIFTFYSHRFLKIVKENRSTDIKLFFALFVATINLIILSKNLISSLLFYGILTLLNHFFALKFLYKKQNKFSQFFSLIFYLQFLCFFAAIFLTHNLVGDLNLIGQETSISNLSQVKFILLLALYFLALFSLISLPFYFLINFFNNELIFTYIFCFFSYGFVAISLVIKLLNIFNFEHYFLISSEFFENILQFFFFLTITAVSSLLIFSDTVKKTFLYLTFQQLIFALFALFIFTFYDRQNIILPLISFALTTSLLFVTIANLMLYFNNSQSKSFLGLFYDMKINSIFLVFAVATAIGIAPTASAVNGFFLIRTIFNHNLIISKLALIPYFTSLIIFAAKLLLPLLSLDSVKKSKEDLELINKIDSDSGLVLSSLTLVLANILAAMILPFLTI